MARLNWKGDNALKPEWPIRALASRKIGGRYEITQGTDANGETQYEVYHLTCLSKGTSGRYGGLWDRRAVGTASQLSDAQALAQRDMDRSA